MSSHLQLEEEQGRLRYVALTGSCGSHKRIDERNDDMTERFCREKDDNNDDKVNHQYHFPFRLCVVQRLFFCLLHLILLSEQSVNAMTMRSKHSINNGKHYFHFQLQQHSTKIGDTSSNSEEEHVEGEREEKATTVIQWLPSVIRLKDVSQSYPDTLWRKLTSSVPRREFAIENLSMTLIAKNDNDDDDDSCTGTSTSERVIEGGFYLLVGASSSGKSALLKLMAGLEEPVTGTVSIESILHDSDAILRSVGEANDDDVNDDKNKNNDTSSRHTSRPIYLDQRPVYVNTPQTVQQLLESQMTRSFLVPEQQSTNDHGQQQQEQQQLMFTKLTQQLLHDLSEIFDLEMNQKVVDLSPSETYCCRLAEACLESSLQGIFCFCPAPSQVLLPPSAREEKRQQQQQQLSVLLPSPILLLDEWMDKETSVVIRKVQSSIQQFVKKSDALVFSVTHYPNRYGTGTVSSSGSSSMSNNAHVNDKHLKSKHGVTDEKSAGVAGTAAVRRITLNAGKILSVE